MQLQDLCKANIHVNKKYTEPKMHPVMRWSHDTKNNYYKTHAPKTGLQRIQGPSMYVFNIFHYF